LSLIYSTHKLHFTIVRCRDRIITSKLGVYMVHCSGLDEGERVAYHTFTTFIHPSLRQSLNYQLLYPNNLYSNTYIVTLLLKIAFKYKIYIYFSRIFTYYDEILLIIHVKINLPVTPNKIYLQLQVILCKFKNICFS
jgi:hypothetical protein